MMVGEYEFDGNFERDGTSTDYLIFGKLVVFTLFIFVAAIVGLNLLIGLAVEDIQVILELEDSIGWFPFQPKFKDAILTSRHSRQTPIQKF